ncbi:MAG: hypothetical protein KKH12_08755 [Gammaproteobacteria bacterium]|nr:hypothetical protein [Gammaproteobacteria bacterium]MBU1481754.1 hypothetical protein [Gammaproteobacteria bacterium]
MDRKALLKFAALFLLAYTVLLALSLQFGRQYVELLLPLYRWEIGWCAPDYSVQSLAVQESRGEAVVALNVKLMRYTFVAGHLLHPGGDISSSTLAGHALQHALLIFSLLAAWPASGFSRRIALFCLAVPLLLLVEMLDVPLVLLGSNEDIILANVAPTADSLLVSWMNFMNGGGRLALPIAAALVAIGTGRILGQRN